MTPQISTVNKFLAMTSCSGVSRSPTDFFVYTSVRMNSLGYIVNKPKDSDLTAEYGDVYFELDQWHDALDPNVNQLEAKTGEKHFYNLIWTNYGEEIAARIVTASELADEQSTSVYVSLAKI